MEMHLGTPRIAARCTGLFALASVLLVGCIPQQHRLADQARALRWEQDSLTLVARMGAVSSEEVQLKKTVVRLDSTLDARSKQRDSLLVVLRNQSRRADTLTGLVQRESVLRDLLRMDLAAAQQAEQLQKKRADSLKIEVQYLTEKLNARLERPAQPRPAGSVRPPR